MGIVFGKTGVAEPTFEVLASCTSYEIRRYSPRFGITTTCASDNTGFRSLAGYIGVTGPPQNSLSESISMTAPVIKSEGKMQFILPQNYDDLSKIPKPSNENVKVFSIPEETGAVKVFSGWVNDAKAEEVKASLYEGLREGGVVLGEGRKWQLWQYNPPFTIPWLRRNEIWVELKEEEVKKAKEYCEKSE
ncbi:hypothetical protein TrVE_jg2233 [Triparma verrucosa]|uniref:SOUL heme-binding protein n=1 Tax=Triparma verrucosa TaxID=1606542 RepID=A0A9W7ERP1_9STRA|nr:hypothetical protein TrVE_jg2233 [Triparma verrucosa]